MPANMSLMFGISPPFPTDNNILAIHSRTCYSAQFDVFNNRMPIERVPPRSFSNPKSCLKAASSQPEIISDLEVKSLEDFKSPAEAGEGLQMKKNKRVRFADSNGGVLTLIKYLTESTYEPPKKFTSDDFLKDLFSNLNFSTARDANEESKLVLLFQQPAANYTNFKSRLESLNVSLENIVIKSRHRVHGTVKVMNLAFEKAVNIRITFDQWRSSKNIRCDYVNNSQVAGGNHDTFQFHFDFPANCDQVEFCVNFQCDGEEYWDNNAGNNYVITNTKAKSKTARTTPISIPSSSGRFPNGTPYPSTYCELPSPQEKTWLPLEQQTPFY